MLALLYFNGEGVEQDYSKSRYWFTKAANKGEAHAQFWLGRIFELGLGTDKSPKKAMALYKKAAEQGMAEAQNSLGVYLCNQEAQNKKELGLFWLRKAAVQGYTEAQYNLAVYRQKQK